MKFKTVRVTVALDAEFPDAVRFTEAEYKALGSIPSYSYHVRAIAADVLGLDSAAACKALRRAAEKRAHECGTTLPEWLRWITLARAGKTNLAEDMAEAATG